MDGPFSPEEGPPLRHLEDPARSVRPGHRRPRRLGGAAGLERRLPAPRPAGLRRLRLGRRPSAGDADGGPGDLRDARPRLHPASVLGRQVPGHLCRHPPEDPVPQGAGRQLHRADADLRVRRVREQPDPPGHRRTALQLLGLQHGRLLCAEGRLCRDRQAGHAGGRAQGAGQGAAPQRHRGHPGRGLQPHGRGQRERPVHLLPRDRQQDLLHAHAGRLLLQLQRHRQHAELQQPGRAEHGARLPALLGLPSTTSTASASTWPRSWAAIRRARRCPIRRCWNRWPSTRSWPSAS